MSLVNLASALCAEFLAVSVFGKCLKLLKTYSGKPRISAFLLVIVRDLGIFLLALATVIFSATIGSLIIKLIIVGIFLIVTRILILEMVYFSKTGSIGDFFLLTLVAANFREIKVAISGQPVAKVLLYLLAFASLFLPAILIAYALEAAGSDFVAAPFAAGLFLVGALLIALPIPQSGSRLLLLNRSNLALLFGDALSREAWKAVEPDGALLLVAQGRPAEAAAAAKPAEGGRKRNVILYILESARHFSHLPAGSMPFLNRLARDSIMVESMSCVVPHTTVALVPILSGRYPVLGPSTQPRSNLARVLGEAGYRTAFFTPADLRFEGKGRMLEEFGFGCLFGAQNLDERGNQRRGYLGYVDEDMIGPSVEWTTQASRDCAPFFLTMLSLSSHHPYSIPSAEGRKAAPRTEHGRYLASLDYADRCLERFVAELEAVGLLEDSILVVVGDHGQAFGEHGRFYHSASLWDETLRIPCIVHAPGLEKPRIVRGARSQLDLMPTIAELVGLEDPPATCGHSLLHAVPEGRILFFSSWIENQSLALRFGKDKFIYHFDREPAEFYDTNEDPFEMNNLIGTIDLTMQRKYVDTCLATRHALARDVTA